MFWGKDLYLIYPKDQLLFQAKVDEKYKELVFLPYKDKNTKEENKNYLHLK